MCAHGINDARDDLFVARAMGPGGGMYCTVPVILLTQIDTISINCTDYVLVRTVLQFIYSALFQNSQNSISFSVTSTVV